MHPTARIGLLLVWIWAFAHPLKAAESPAPPVRLERGMTVRLLRDEVLRFYGNPMRHARKGETFQVLDVRPATNQIFFGVQDHGRLIALSAPLDAVAPAKAADKARRIEESAALFAGLIPTLKITIPDAQVELLRKEPRKYVEVSIEEAGAKTFEHVGLKLKGSAGSFQGIDARPGFSLNLEKFKGADRFHGLKRFQLNNCNQDGTALNELISGDIARRAGVPASRCTHALVTLNGRDLGLYVLKEGFTQEFLAAFFKQTDGHLYDGGFCADVRPDMEVDRGDPAHQERLKELLDAISDPNHEGQVERLGKVVEVDAYLRYLALENILCHWDGYSFNRNNYRVYENPETGRFHFILHGMDQMFGDAAWNITREPGASVGAILWRSPEIRERYRKQLLDIYTRVLKPVDWASRTEEVGKRLLHALDPEKAKGYEPNIAAARDKVRARMTHIRQQLEFAVLLTSLKTKGRIELGAAPWVSQVENAEANQAVIDRRNCFHLKATGDANASWRLPVSLPAGKYRFQAVAKVKKVQPLPTETGEGAGIRISGGTKKGPAALAGDTDWKTLAYDFQSDGAPQTLVMELRAKAGEMWVDTSNLKVSLVP